jgi:colicin import membrane protein
VLTQKLRRNPGRVRAVFYAVLVHAAVIGLIVIGFRWTSQPASDQKVIQAVALPQTPPKKAEAPKQPAPDEELARQKAEAEKRQQAELRKKQEEQQRLEIARKQMAEEEKARKQKEQEQKRAAEAARQQEQKRQQKQAEQSLQQQLEAEEKARQDAARAARAATVVDQYKALIRQRVSQSWSRPLGSAKGLKCTVRVRLTPSGEVLAATVVKSSGNPVFDRSVENAVYKAAPLPLPNDPTLFDNFREIDFIFDPDKDKEANT